MILFEGSRGRRITLGVQDVLRPLLAELHHQLQQDGRFSWESVERERDAPLHPQDYSIESVQQDRHNRNDTANIFKLLQLSSNFFKSKIEEMNL